MSANPELPADDQVTIEIDGQSMQVPKGSMIIEAADSAGIAIPRFCYHSKLSVAANCRMCMVEVEKVPKPLPACATPVADGMKIFTGSDFAKSAQKAVMEFLLINHPLDCPICDQGGECELQDVALGYGRSISRFAEKKRVVPDKNIGPLIATDMTRCIHCTRCVRFMDEIAGTYELGGIGRGENTRIGTCIERAIESEMSGNVIDVCPVGALTSKPFRFRARAWELNRYTIVAPHDCIGSNLYLHSRRGEVMRVVPRDNEEINETWISDRDRYSYQALASDERLEQPMVKQDDGSWQTVDWDVALERVVSGMKGVSADDLGMLVSPNSSIEEMYLLRCLADGLGCHNLDHRLRQADTSAQKDDPAFPWLGQDIAALESQNAVLLVGSNVTKDQPIAAHRLRKATRKGAGVMTVNPVSYGFHFDLVADMVAAPSKMTAALAAVAMGVMEAKSVSVPGEVSDLADDADKETARTIAKNLIEGDKSSVMLGMVAFAHPQFSVLRSLAAMIAEYSGATLGYLPEGANTAGAWISGVVPHRGPAAGAQDSSGRSATDMIADARKAYMLWGVEPESDCWDAAASLNAMQAAGFVVCGSAFVSDEMKSYADVLLPVAAHSETSGTFVNAEGRWQSFAGAVKPKGEARPGWKVLRVLGNMLELDGFEYNASDEVRDEVRNLWSDNKPDNKLQNNTLSTAWSVSGVERVGDTAIYAADSLVRRAPALQATPDAQASNALHLSVAQAQSLGLSDGGQAKVSQDGKSATVTVVVDGAVPANSVWLSAGTEAVRGLGPAFGSISVEPV